MTDTVLVGIIAAVPATIAAAAALVVSVRGNRKIDELHLSINGRMAQLIDMTSKAASADGKAAGIEQERQRAEA